MKSVDMSLMTKVDAIDLTREIERMQMRGGLDLATAALSADLYRKFLYLSVAFPDISFTPSKLIDEAWHEHMADTAKYRADCMALFGGFLDHDPKINGALMEGQYDVTRSYFMTTFGIDLVQIAKDGYAASCGGALAASCGGALERAASCGGAVAASCGGVLAKPASCGGAVAASCGGAVSKGSMVGTGLDALLSRRAA